MKKFCNVLREAFQSGTKRSADCGFEAGFDCGMEKNGPIGVGGTQGGILVERIEKD
jgi:hypothetical protein